MDMDLSSAQSFVSSKYTLYALFGGSLILWLLYTLLYRLLWSPIAKFPGPKLAAATFWYEAYYDIFLGGQYQFHIDHLHDTYGPIIRISPEELHIRDPYYYDQINVGAATRKTDKYERAQNQNALRWSTVTTIPHDLHRRRRAMISNHFSTAAVQRLGPLIRDKIQKFKQRLEQAAKTGQPINLTHAYMALTLDIITAYCFDNSWNYLEDEDFSPQFFEMIQRNIMGGHIVKQFPWMMVLIRALPEWASDRLLPDQANVVAVQRYFVGLVKEIKRKRAEHSALTDEKVGSAESNTSHSIFHAMLDADVPEAEKKVERLGEEAQLLTLAGSLTTAHTLATITYHLNTQPLLLARLREELSARFPGNTELNGVPQTTIETLPYLTAVIYEGVRLSYGILQRLHKVSPDLPLKYGDWEIPAGVPVCMSSYQMHHDSEIFPDSHEFRPERWLPMDTVGQPLSKFLTSFNKGSRQCVGINLAWAELFLAVPVIFGCNLDIQLHDVDFERDIKIVRDGLTPESSADSKRLRAIITYRE